MPKLSEKKRLMKLIEEMFINDLIKLEVFEKSTGNKENKENKIIENYILSTVIVENFRYAAPFILGSVPKCRNFAVNILPNLDEGRFRELVRVNWKNFKTILNLIKDDAVFNGPRSSKQFPVALQLIIVLYRLGCSGEGASITKIASFFGIGDGGTIQNITERVFKAVLKRKEEYIFWPDVEERRKIVHETFHELPHCIGYVDGTEIKLAEKPSNDPEAYFSRTKKYSIKVQATCDHKLRIRHMVVGYPGSVHDSRIYQNCDLSKNTSQYFSDLNWIVGDSAYVCTPTVIVPFKSNQRTGTAEERNNFNRILSQYRIRIEHCFGHLKERFSSLKELKIKVSDKKSLKFACSWIIVCAILHNIILRQNENEDSFYLAEDASDLDVEEDEENESTTETTTTTIHGQTKRRALLEILKQMV